MNRSNVASKGNIVVGICDIENEEHEIKSREERVGKVDVLRQAFPSIIPSVERVGGCEYGCASVKSRSDAGLGDRHSLR